MPRLKAAQRREQLIDVATKLFAKTGYEATTTAAIAQRLKKLSWGIDLSS